jgi:putative endonuclease
MAEMYYVYVLRIKASGRYYIGQTQNLAKRLEKHSLGKTKSVKNRGEFALVYTEQCFSRAQAMRREKQIKAYKGGNAFKKLLEGWDEGA